MRIVAVANASLKRQFIDRSLPVVLSVIVFFHTHPTYAQDLGAGATVFKQCTSCHAIGPNAKNQFGPHLNGVMQRAAGSAENYAYSEAFENSIDTESVWDTAKLDAFLQAPMSYMPGTKMAYQGLSNADDRASVIAYLASIDSSGQLPEPAATKPEKTSQTSDGQQRSLARDIPIPEHGLLHLGRPALDAEVIAWDIDIRPDGVGLPSGSGDVITGGELYDEQCASCHGVFGEGEGRWPILAGGQDSLVDDRPEKTIGSYWPYLSTVYDYIRRAMPFGNARSLSDDDVYALTAYLLYLNDLVDEEFELSDQNFTDIRLPNENNFMSDTRDEEPTHQIVGEPCMQNCLPGIVKVINRAQILNVTPDAEEASDAPTVD